MSHCGSKQECVMHLLNKLDILVNQDKCTNFKEWSVWFEMTGVLYKNCACDYYEFAALLYSF